MGLGLAILVCRRAGIDPAVNRQNVEGRDYSPLLDEKREKQPKEIKTIIQKAFYENNYLHQREKL